MHISITVITRRPPFLLTVRVLCIAIADKSSQKLPKTSGIVIPLGSVYKLKCKTKFSSVCVEWIFAHFILILNAISLTLFQSG